MLSLLSTLALALCGDTPEKTFAEVKAAVAARNWGALYDVIAPSELKKMHSDLDELKKDLNNPERAEEIKHLAATLGVKVADLPKVGYRDFVAGLLKFGAERDPRAFDRDLKKFADGGLSGTTVVGDLCVLKIKMAGGEEEGELLREGGKWYLSLVGPDERRSHQRWASASLRTLMAASADFRANDRNKDGVNNFWVKDVAGLYGLVVEGEALKLIERNVAERDKTPGGGKYPLVGAPENPPPYFFAALKRYRENGAAKPYDDGKGVNPLRFGFVSWPAFYPRTGKLTYIVNERGEVLQKDTGGKPVEEFPEDPAKEGWKSRE